MSLKEGPTAQAGMTLGPDDFTRLFGVGPQGIGEEELRLVRGLDFRYRRIPEREQKVLVDDILRQIDAGNFSLAGKEGKSRWDKGWEENLKAFVDSGGKVDKLVPKYIRPGQPLRLDRGYVVPQDPAFEWNWYRIFRAWLFKAYLAEVDSIFEFGCGSGHNLAALAGLFPEKKLIGLDWAEASKDIVDAMGKKFGWCMEGRVFDFFSPDRSLKIGENAAILTVGAVEQTGKDWGKLFDFILESRPSICVHVEPICEWYDPSDPSDEAAIRFHKARNYWQGFPDWIRQKESQGRVEVLKAKRSFFGSLYLEGYSQLIWRPSGK